MPRSERKSTKTYHVVLPTRRFDLFPIGLYVLFLWITTYMAVYRSVDALLPRDKDNEPIQVLTPNTITNAAVVVTSTASALPTGAQIVEVSTSTDSYILFGTSGSTVANTTGQFHPKGISLYTVPTGSTHLCHIRDTADGRISITKMV